MKSYCVIEFKDKQEEKKILNFLSKKTEAEYKVTADLKKFVAEKFSVTIVENVVVSPNDIDTVTIKKEIIENTVDVAPTIINTLQNEQSSSTQSFSVPDLIVAVQPIPDNDNTENLMNMDYYGAFAQYLNKIAELNKTHINDTATENLLEEEMIEDANNVGSIVNDGDGYISVYDVLMANVVNGRSTKRPRCSAGENNDEEYTPPAKRSRKTDGTLEEVTGRKMERTTCKKCGTEVMSVYSHKMRHVTMHTDIKRFKCLVNGCRSKSKLRQNMTAHMRMKHSNQLNAFANIKLTSEQIAEIDSKMKECFDDSEGSELEIDNIIDPVEDAPTTIKTIHNEHDSTQSPCDPDSIGVDQSISVVANTQSLMNMDDYGAFVQYLNSMAELNKTNINDTATDDLLKEGMTIEDSSEEYPPSAKRSKKTNETLEKKTGGRKERTNCKKCGREVNANYSAKMDHIAKHTDIMKFECLVDGCGAKSKLKAYITTHMKIKHQNQLNAFANIELTSEQNDELDSKTRECFGDSDCNSDDHCQVCYQKIGGDSRNYSFCKREHALYHVGFVIYKCIEDGCSFESKTMSSMAAHRRMSHPTRPTSEFENDSFNKIKLTAEQESKIDDIVRKCFPNLDKNVSSAT